MGTHPDANPDPPYGGFSTATADGEPYILPPAPPVYQRYEDNERVAYVFVGDRPYLPAAEDLDEGVSCSNTVTLHRTLDDFERYIEFRRAADGGWEWTQFNDRNEEEMLEAWEWIALVEHNDIKIAFPDANGEGTYEQLGPDLFVWSDSECVSLATQNDDDLRTEHPRRCLP